MHHYPSHAGELRRITMLRFASAAIYDHGVDLEDFSIPGREAVVDFLREHLRQIRWAGHFGRREYDGEAHVALSEAMFQEQMALDRVRRREVVHA